MHNTKNGDRNTRFPFFIIIIKEAIYYRLKSTSYWFFEHKLLLFALIIGTKDSR